jgi:3-oxoadipate enol-lactonase / 4-carboxymuconolactone decarboxylase
MPMIRANRVNIFYDLTGPVGAPVVVFSNSLGTTLEMWDAQVRALSNRFRCLRYDTRGHGRSEVLDEPASIDDLADDLAGLLEALAIPTAHVVGLSLGGMTAQALAAAHPERVESLVLMATAAYLPPAEGWDQRAQTVRAQGMGALVDVVMQRWFTADTVALAPELVKPVRDRFSSLDPRGYAVTCLAIRDMDLRSRIGAIKVPTLVVAGEDDPATPIEMAEEIARLIPGAELTVVPEAAHLIAVEQAEQVNILLALFLGRVAGERPEATGGVSFEAGLANRKSVLGVEHVQRSLENAGDFAGPWQDFITRNAWGEIWGDPTLPWKTRSLVTLAMMVALHREEEFKLHVRPALKNGVSVEELRSLLMQSAIYAGVPAANAAFRWVREVLGDELT